MIAYIVVAFWVGALVGVLLMGWYKQRTTYQGTIVVTRNDGKTYYTLVLEDYPEKIEFQKTVVFKVESPDRD
jgi:purine nucleoside permease